MRTRPQYRSGPPTPRRASPSRSSRARSWDRGGFEPIDDRFGLQIGDVPLFDASGRLGDQIHHGAASHDPAGTIEPDRYRLEVATDAEIDALLEVMRDAQQAGAKQVHEREYRIAGSTHAAPPLRWVETTSPPAVYFPFEHAPRTPAAVLMIVCYVLTAAGVILGLVAFSAGDLRVAGTFALMAVVAAIAGYRFDSRSAQERSDASEGVETRGLYLTPDDLILVEKGRRWSVPRSQVTGFGERRRQTRSSIADRIVVVEYESGPGRAHSADLSADLDDEHAEIGRAWLAGDWPLPLPR